MTVEDLPDLMATLRAVHATGRTRDLEWRVRQLEGIERLVVERESEIAEAVAADLGRDAAGTYLGEIALSRDEARHARRHVRSWMRRRRQSVPMVLQPGTAWIQYEPLGVVMVIAPWNYPVQLALAPLVAAVSAGNCVVVKPSELAPACSALLARLIPEYVDPEAVRIVEGDGAVTQDLLAQGFDHVLFTGGTEIGRKIMAGAAATLTPVTLELGGKSPAVVVADADLEIAARRIVWTKILNSGQTCIAPDYVLADRSIRDELVRKIREKLIVFRADEPTPGMRVVNERQFDRLTGYLEATKGEVVTGGGHDRTTLTIEPTVIVDPDPDEPAMTDELFGPILPVLAYDSVDEVVAFVNGRPKPLALYVFTKSKDTGTRLVDQMPSGGAVINHAIVHLLAPDLPFGGVGPSGTGAYHGEWGFQTFSHRRSVLAKRSRPDFQVVYPPYGERGLKLLRKIF